MNVPEHGDPYKPNDKLNAKATLKIVGPPETQPGMLQKGEKH